VDAHTSTALEGNTLTLGEVAFVLVRAHCRGAAAGASSGSGGTRAIERLYGLLESAGVARRVSAYRHRARQRRQYIGLLAEYELAVGQVRSGHPFCRSLNVWPVSRLFAGRTGKPRLIWLPMRNGGKPSA